MRLFVGLIAIVVVLLSAAYLAAESLGWMSPGSVTAWIQSAGASGAGRWAAAGLVIGLLAGDLVLPVPSSIVMTLAGGCLGWAGGTAASFLGAMGSAALGFALCRRFGRSTFERLVGTRDAARVESFMERYGIWGIVLSRGVPMLTEVVSCAAGLSRLPARAFFSLTAAGTLPICAVYAWAGSRGVETGMGWPFFAALALPALGLAIAKAVSALSRET